MSKFILCSDFSGKSQITNPVLQGLQIHHLPTSRNTTPLKSSIDPVQCPSSHCTMQAEDNPLIMLKKSKHKSIEDLQKQVRINQSQLQRIWNLKKEEKQFWKKGLNEKEVGWCGKHWNFCDVDSKCKPMDPIPASSAEGRLMYI